MKVLATLKADPAPWYANHDEICELAEWLHDRGDLPNARSLIEYFRKPWKWDDEYNQMAGTLANPPTHGECECGTITEHKDSHARWECDGCRDLREDS